jgi:hypothetical protein
MQPRLSSAAEKSLQKLVEAASQLLRSAIVAQQVAAIEMN